MSDEALVRELRKQIEEAAAEIARLREALRTIDGGLTDEIDARFRDLPQRERTRSRVFSLLVVPRNIARAALGGSDASD